MASDKIENAGLAWELLVEEELQDEESRRIYQQNLAKVKAARDLAAAFEQARRIRETSKAEVARRMDTHAPAISRLFGGDGINPMFSTIFEAAAALGLHIKLDVELSDNGQPPVEVVTHFETAGVSG